MTAASLLRLCLRGTLAFTLATATHAGGQVVPGVGAPRLPPPGIPVVQSPTVSAGKVVTFRLYAPKAGEVLVKSEGLDAVPGVAAAEVQRATKGIPMEKGVDGVWTYSLGPLMPGAFRYTYLVDGVAATDPENPLSSESLTHVSSLFFVPGNNLFDVRDVPHGAVSSVFYYSKTLGVERRMHIYTPPGYEQGGPKTYPVLYLLHGGGDSDASWSTVGLATTILDNLIADYKAVPMIIVMPAGHLTHEMRQFNPDQMGLDAFNEDFINDILPYVEAHYRVTATRNGRALAGLSMGGVQTLNIGLTHLRLFSSIGVFSSGWFPFARDKFVAAHGPELDGPDKQGLRLLWVGAGKQDIAHDNCLAMLDLLKAHGFAPEYHESPGYHAWSTWQQYISEYLPRLFQPAV